MSSSWWLTGSPRARTARSASSCAPERRRPVQHRAGGGRADQRSDQRLQLRGDTVPGLGEQGGEPAGQDAARATRFPRALGLRVCVRDVSARRAGDRRGGSPRRRAGLPGGCSGAAGRRRAAAQRAAAQRLHKSGSAVARRAMGAAGRIPRRLAAAGRSRPCRPGRPGCARRRPRPGRRWCRAAAVSGGTSGIARRRRCGGPSPGGAGRSHRIPRVAGAGAAQRPAGGALVHDLVPAAPGAGFATGVPVAGIAQPPALDAVPQHGRSRAPGATGHAHAVVASACQQPGERDHGSGASADPEVSASGQAARCRRAAAALRAGPRPGSPGGGPRRAQAGHRASDGGGNPVHDGCLRLARAGPAVTTLRAGALPCAWLTARAGSRLPPGRSGR